jgi:hypothetical protein
MVGHNTFWSINAGPFLGLQVTAGGEGSSAFLPGWRKIIHKKLLNREKKDERKNRNVKGLGELQRGTLGARRSCGGLAALAAGIAWLR